MFFWGDKMSNNTMKSIKTKENFIDENQPILKKVAFVSVTIHMWRGRYQIKNAEITVDETQLDKELTSLPHWRLVPAKWQKKFTTIEMKIRSTLQKKSLQLPIRGVDVLPREAVSDVFKTIDDIIENELNPVVDEFCDYWPTALEQLKESLPENQWNKLKHKIPEDAESLRKKFYVTKYVIPVSGTNFDAIEDDLAEAYADEIKDATQKFIQDTAASLSENLYEELANTVDNFISMLNSKKKFKDNSFDVLRRAFQKLESFKFIASPDLVKMISSVKKSMASINAKIINAGLKQNNSSVVKSLTDALTELNNKINEDLNEIKFNFNKYRATRPIDIE